MSKAEEKSQKRPYARVISYEGGKLVGDIIVKAYNGPAPKVSRERPARGGKKSPPRKAS